MSNDKPKPKKKVKFKTRTKLLIPRKPAADGGGRRAGVRGLRQVIFVLLLVGFSGVFLYNNRDYIFSSAEEFSTAGARPGAGDAAVSPRAERKAEAAAVKAEKRAAAATAKFEKRAAADSVKAMKRIEAERIKAGKLAADVEAKFAKQAADDSVKAAKKIEAERIKAGKRGADVEAKLARKAASDSVRAAKKIEADRIKADKRAADVEAKFARKAAADSLKAVKPGHKKVKEPIVHQSVDEVLGEREFVDTGHAIARPPALAAKQEPVSRGPDISAAKNESPLKQPGINTKDNEIPPSRSDIKAAKKETPLKQSDISTVKNEIPPRQSDIKTAGLESSPKRSDGGTEPPVMSVAKTPEPAAAKKAEPAVAQPAAVKREPLPAQPESEAPKFTAASSFPSVESFVLSDVKCRLADRADLGIFVTAELFFTGGALRREIIFKRGTLETLTVSVVRKHEYGNIRPPALSADLLAAYNDVLDAGQLSRVDVKEFRVSGVTP